MEVNNYPKMQERDLKDLEKQAAARASKRGVPAAKVSPAALRSELDLLRDVLAAARGLRTIRLAQALRDVDQKIRAYDEGVGP